jgi:molybdate/tungstate transport system substrate-binding protein
MFRARIHILWLLPTLLLFGCSSNESNTIPIVVFHAGSLSIPLQAVEVAFEAEYPQYDLRREPGGSRTGARKVTDLNRACDVLISADVGIIEDMLIPDHADWALPFATNELCIAYRKNATFLDDIAFSGTWQGYLAQKFVRVGRSDPNSDPCGSYTVQVLELADRFYGTDDRGAIMANSEPYVRPKSSDLIALLETKTIDYAFIYRSVAEQHGLDYIPLPPEINLGDPNHAEAYAEAKATISGKTPADTVTMKGKPIVYGLTIPRNSVHPGAAAQFVSFLMDPDKGLGILQALHQQTLTGMPTPGYDKMPVSLQPFAAPTSDGSTE